MSVHTSECLVLSCTSENHRRTTTNPSFYGSRLDARQASRRVIGATGDPRDPGGIPRENTKKRPRARCPLGSDITY
eukprot:1192079-Prorocentrum_minimum.AAC.1